MEENNLQDEKQPVAEQVKPQKVKKPRNKLVLPIVLLWLLVAIAGGVWYFLEQQKFVYTDKADIEVPMIALTSNASGVLKEVLVAEGSRVLAHQAVARVGDEMIYSEIGGVVAAVKKDIGAIYNPGQAVVTMYDPGEMRVVASIEEDKGLTDIKVGDKVRFTVDAFGSQEFQGLVEEVRPVSKSGDVVFNISDKRQVQQFEVKIAYDVTRYPDFRNGMSARVWITK